jgi:hypothetical protein
VLDCIGTNEIIQKYLNICILGQKRTKEKNRFTENLNFYNFIENEHYFYSLNVYLQGGGGEGNAEVSKDLD